MEYRNNFILFFTIVIIFSISTLHAQNAADPNTKQSRLNKLYEFFSRPHPDSLEKGIKSAEDAIILAAETGNKFIQTKALLFLGKTAFKERNIPKAKKLLLNALSLSKELKNEYLQAESYLQYAIFLGHAVNRPDSALFFAKNSYSIGLAIGDTTLLKSSLSYLATLYRLCHDPVKAISTAKTALEYCKKDKISRGNIYSELVLVYADYGKPKEAAYYFDLALQISEETKYDMQIASLANKMGELEDLDFETSVKYRLKALDIYKKIKEPFGIGYTYNLLGSNYASSGRSKEGIEYFLKAIDILTRIDNRQHLAFACANLAGEYVKLGKTGLAWPYVQKAVELGNAINDKLVQCDAYKTAAFYFKKTNETDKALKYLEYAASCAKEIKNPGFLKDIYNEYSLCYDAKGDTKNALYYLRLKNEIADTIAKQNAQKSYIEMLVKYETIKTKEEMEEAKQNATNLKEESEKKSVLFWSITGSAAAIIIALTFFFRKKISVFFSFYKNISNKRFKDKRNNKSVIKALEGDNNENIQIDTETVSSLKENLKSLIEVEKKYLNSELTLNEAAKLLNTNTTYLSRIINEQSGMNFSNYINKYRIEEAKRLLDEGKQDSLTFEGIGKSCGFLSRSAFNQAFKKFTGLTPTEYSAGKKNNL